MRRRSVPRPVDPVIASLADRQFGVVARRQLLAAGVTARTIDRRIANRRLRPLHHGVYAVGHTALRLEGWWMAALLAAGDGAVLSHRTAAAVWGIRPPGGARVDVSIRSRAGRAHRPGIAMHRPRTLTVDEITRHEGLPVTTPARTLIDLAEVIRTRALASALSDAERLRLDLGDLHALLDRHTAKRGAARVRRQLADLHAADAWTRSDLERRFLRLVRRHGLPQPAVNAWVAGMEVDFIWRDERVVVEVDGHAYHRTRQAFEDDHRRTVELRLAGYEVLRFTDRQIVADGATVARAVGHALAYAVRSRAISSKTDT